jgi:probable HAF family extracellular repeat protein
MFRDAFHQTRVLIIAARVTMFAALVVLGSSLHASAGPPGAQASFQGLGDLPSGSFLSIARGISADGAVVTGFGTYEFQEGITWYSQAFRWTETEGMVGLGSVFGYPTWSQAYAVSADGLVVVGRSVSELSDEEAFRWTSSSGMVGLGDLPGSYPASEALGVSEDGSVIVGFSYSSASGHAPEAFRWTAATGMVGLGDLPGGLFGSTAYGVSGDGTVVVGNSITREEPYLTYRAFRWTQAEGMVNLGILPGTSPDYWSSAFAASRDGSVIVGRSGPEAFRWTPMEGMIGLGDLPGGIFGSSATAVSPNGLFIVGTGRSEAGSEAFLWDGARGMRNIREILTNDFGLDLTGWMLSEAKGVSTDGRTIVGQGINPNGDTEAWRAVLPSCAPCQLFGDVYPAAPPQATP